MKHIVNAIRSVAILLLISTACSHGEDGQKLAEGISSIPARLITGRDPDTAEHLGAMILTNCFDADLLDQPNSLNTNECNAADIIDYFEVRLSLNIRLQNDEPLNRVELERRPVKLRQPDCTNAELLQLLAGSLHSLGLPRKPLADRFRMMLDAQPEPVPGVPPVMPKYTVVGLLERSQITFVMVFAE